LDLGGGNFPWVILFSGEMSIMGERLIKGFYFRGPFHRHNIRKQFPLYMTAGLLIFSFDSLVRQQIHLAYKKWRNNVEKDYYSPSIP
jgi:hypothetical protein